MNTNSIKGNCAEYLVLHVLLKNGISAWHTGGNNRKWDILVQTSSDDFIPASVKYASTRLPIFSEQDETESKGIYFIVVPSKDPLATDEVLLFNSATIAQACRNYKSRAIKTPSYKNRPKFRNFRITKESYENGKNSLGVFVKSMGAA